MILKHFYVSHAPKYKFPEYSQMLRVKDTFIRKLSLRKSPELYSILYSQDWEKKTCGPSLAVLTNVFSAFCTGTSDLPSRIFCVMELEVSNRQFRSSGTHLVPVKVLTDRLPTCLETARAFQSARISRFSRLLKFSTCMRVVVHAGGISSGIVREAF